MTEQMYSSHAGGNGKEGSYAPPGWSIDSARKAAAEEGLELTDAAGITVGLAIALAGLGGWSLWFEKRLARSKVASGGD